MKAVQQLFKIDLNHVTSTFIRNFKITNYIVYITARDTLWLLTFFGFGVNYMLRININIAIVDMVKRRPVNQESKAAQCYSLNETTESVILNTGSEISASNVSFISLLYLPTKLNFL